MNWRAIIADAVLGFIVALATPVMAMLTQPGIRELSDISQVAWLIAFLGAALSTAKLVQSRIAQSPTGSVNNPQGGFVTIRFAALLAALSIAALLFGGCASFQKNQGSEKLLFQIATMKAIEADRNNIPARAATIRNVATGAKSFFDTGTATVDQLAVELAKRIAPLNLSPADQMLANALVQTVVAELQARIDEAASKGLPGSVPADTVYQISTVLGWVIDATLFYP